MFYKIKKISHIFSTFFIVSLALISLICKTYHYKHTFSTGKWINHPAARTDIADNLLAKHPLTGMTLSEVETLLGPETENAYFKRENNLVYYLGLERGILAIDSEWLVIEFQNGRVSKTYITTD